MSGSFSAQSGPTAEPARGWSRWLLRGLAGTVAFVGVVMLVRWVVDPGVDDEAIQVEPNASLSSSVSEAAGRRGDDSARPTWVSVRVEGLPPNAEMRLDGLPASSPFRLHAGGQHVVEIRAEGYETRRIEFVADRNRTLQARMRPADLAE